MPKRVLLGCVLVVSITAVVCWMRWDRDLWLINRRSEQLAQTLHRTPDEGLLPLAQRVLEITTFFARSPTVIAGDPLPAIASREDLISVASASLQALKKLETRMLERETRWLQPHTEAVMHVTVEVTAEWAAEKQVRLHHYELTWIREDRRWVIATAKLNEQATSSGQ